MQERLKARLTLLLLAAAMIPAAQATFHFMKVVEIFPGTAASPNAQYVVIQMYVGGQQFVSGHTFTVFDAAGSLIATFTFPGNVANGANQARILVATPQAEAFFGVDADLAMTPALLAAGGKVCFANTVDCVAWGGYTGSATGVGTPFNAAAGLQSGQAAVRRLDLAGSATVLDAADDTNNCANDFVSGLPAPRNNAGTVGTVPAATCGNGALEGLEQCDDGNLINGDGCSSTCALDAVAARRASGDHDGDGKSDVFWRNTSTGANVIWRSGNAATRQATVGVTDQRWTVAGKGDFDGDGKADVFWRHASTGANTIWKSGNAATPQATVGVTNQGWKIVGTGDFDGDGKVDVFWRNTSNGANAIWKSGNASTQQAVVGVTNQNWKVVGVGDFDGDGKVDVFWRDGNTGANTIWKSGNAATRQATVGVTNQGWKVVGVGDFDGDGKSDVFWRNTSNGANAIWKSGNASTQQAVVGVTNQSWKVVGTGDFDGDGRADVFWRNSSNGANAIWKSGNASTQQAVATVTDQAWIVVPYEGQALGGTSAAVSRSLSIADVATTEGNSGTSLNTFTVRLSQAATSAVTFNVATANGTAFADSDYRAVSLVGQSIPVGQTSSTFVVPVIGDVAVEADETFLVNVGNVVGAVVADGTAVGTIVNDDEGDDGGYY